MPVSCWCPRGRSRGPAEWAYHTDHLSPVLVKLDLGVGLHQDLDQDHAIIGAAADTLHKAGIADAPFILDIAQMRNVDARRAS